MRSRLHNTARVDLNNRTQVVTIPLEYQFPKGVKEVFIRQVGENRILSLRPLDWSAFLESPVRATDDFMQNLKRPAPQERGY